jgi:regulator of replication initiation timing
MITAEEARQLGKKLRFLSTEILRTVGNSGLDEVQGVLVYLAATNETLAQENEALKKRISELEDAAGKVRD